MNNLTIDMLMDVVNNDIKSLAQKEKYHIRHRQSIINNVSPVVTENTDGINGLWYIKNYLSPIEIYSLKEKILVDQVKFEPITNSTNSRRVAHFGYYYSYDRSGLKEAPAIPDALSSIVDGCRINKLLGKNIIAEDFEQLIINEYKSSQQIAYHIDHVKQFGPVIACITIGQAVPISFKLGDTIKSVDIEEGSMYIMTGDSRYKWRHSLVNKNESNRYSLTYRTINK